VPTEHGHETVTNRLVQVRRRVIDVEFLLLLCSSTTIDLKFKKRKCR
jgi:hypothetical protein